jgi:hypothetical protein
MLTNREFGQVMTALTHGAHLNISGMPHLSLQTAFEVIRNYVEGNVIFEIKDGKVSWNIIEGAPPPASSGKLLELVQPPIPASCLASPGCYLKAGHEGPCTEKIP